MLIGVISDTHGLMRQEALAALHGCERILHAGDIGKPAVLEALAAIAPVIAIRGNNDRADVFPGVPETRDEVIEAARIHLVHDVKSLPRSFDASAYRLIVSGHSHKPSLEARNGTTFLNPGSAGPRRFKLPLSVARVWIEGGVVRAEIVLLDVDR